MALTMSKRNKFVIGNLGSKQSNLKAVGAHFSWDGFANKRQQSPARCGKEEAIDVAVAGLHSI